MFNVVKLTLAPVNPIEGHHPHPPPLPEIIDREEEWVVEEVLDSKMMNQKLCYLVKWEGFRIEHNSWEPWDNIHTLELVMDFHWRHPAAPCRIRTVIFDSIPFCPSSPFAVLGCHSLEEGGGRGGRCQDTQFHLASLTPLTSAPTLPLTPFLTSLHTADSLDNLSQYNSDTSPLHTHSDFTPWRLTLFSFHLSYFILLPL